MNSGLLERLVLSQHLGVVPRREGDSHLEKRGNSVPVVWQCRHAVPKAIFFISWVYVIYFQLASTCFMN